MEEEKPLSLLEAKALISSLASQQKRARDENLDFVYGERAVAPKREKTRKLLEWGFRAFAPNMSPRPVVVFTGRKPGTFRIYLDNRIIGETPSGSGHREPQEAAQTIRVGFPGPSRRPAQRCAQAGAF